MQTSLIEGHPPQVQDADHLRLLSIFHYVMAGLAALSAGTVAVQITMMNRALGDLEGSVGEGSPMSASGQMGSMGLIFGVICFLMLLGAIFHFLCGRWLAACRHRAFCFFVACFSCLNIPLGLVLGVFTIVVLQRPSVRAIFDRRA